MYRNRGSEQPLEDHGGLGVNLKILAFFPFSVIIFAEIRLQNFS